MKLLVISHSCAAAINQQLYADVENLSNAEITIIHPSNWKNEYGNSAPDPRWPEFRGKLIGIPVWRPGDIILHAYRGSLASLYKQIDPDVIYVNHEPYALATAQAYWANARSVNRPIGFYSCQNIRKRYPPPFCWMERAVYRASNFAFPITRDVDSVIRSKGFNGMSTILPLGFDPAVYYPRASSAEIKQELMLGPNEVLFGYVGRVVEEKGLATMLRGLAQVKDLPWRLVVVGSGPFEAEFDQMAAELGLSDRIIRRGFIPHERVPMFYSACNAILVPSETRRNWKEQFGRVIVESLACGTAVIGSDSGEIPNLLRETGGGLVFPEGEPAALAHCVRRLIIDEPYRRSLADAGRSAVVEQFANQGLARRFADTIERACRAAN